MNNIAFRCFSSVNVEPATWTGITSLFSNVGCTHFKSVKMKVVESTIPPKFLPQILPAYIATYLVIYVISAPLMPACFHPYGGKR